MSLILRAIYSTSQSLSPMAILPAISRRKNFIDVVTRALDALSQEKPSEKLSLSYYENGQKRTLRTPKDLTSALNRGFFLREIDGRIFLSNGLLGGSPPEFSSTDELANHLTKSPDDSTAELLALKVIDIFAQTSLKTEPLIREATALASAGNKKITKVLVTALLKEIEESLRYPSFIITPLFASLRTTLINSKNALDQDELIKILTTSKGHLEQIHRQPETNPKLSAVLSDMCDILDTMVDAEVTKVKRESLHKPLYDCLDGLSGNDDPYIAAQAEYARQALVRTPDDESFFQSVLRHGIEFSKGCTSLYAVYKDKDYSQFLEAYNHFKESLKFQEGKKTWYRVVRFLKLFHETQNYGLLKMMLKDPDIKFSEPQVVNNFLYILHEITYFSHNETERKWAIDTMANLFLDEEMWGKEEAGKHRVLTELKACAECGDEALSSYSKEKLAFIAGACFTKLQKKLIEDFDKIKPAPAFPAPQIKINSVDLISKADPLGHKILKLQRETLNNQDVLNELATYEPALASRSIFDPTANTFDLDRDIDKFIEGDKKVFLLLGDSGGGKSTYLRFLENRLWKEWDCTKPMPIYINLSSLKMPFKQAIKEALSERGFTDKEQEDLKSKYSFLFLMDGYDELNEKRNIYEGNQLNQWKAKTIVTSRKQYLENEQSSYQKYFSPATTNSINDACISPFTSQQIENYYTRLFNQKKVEKSWDEFKIDVESIPDFDSIIRTPFLLRVVAEVLPFILEKHSQSKDHIEALRIEIFDEFINQWFKKEEQRILRQDNVASNTNWKAEFSIFAKKLAREMVEEGTVSVFYEETPDNQPKSKWEEFFSSDQTKTLIRSGVPLQKIGHHTYAFIHKSLLEFFYARAMIDSSFDALDSKLLTDEPEIIHLLAENVLTDPSQIERQLNIIEHSKSNSKMAIAAANAITILNAAQVNLTNRNFKGVRIPGADLSCSNLTCSDFSCADLKGVKLHGATLDYSTIAFSETAGLEFGQKPWIQLGADVYNSTISSNGKWALSRGSDNAIHLWDCQSGRELFCFRGHTDLVTSFAISTDGKFVLSGSRDKTVRLWSCESGDEVRCYRGHTAPIRCVDFSPDGKLILSGSDDMTVCVWNRNAQSQVYCFTGHTGSVVTAVFSPDNTKIFSGGSDNFVQLWDCKTGQNYLKEYILNSLGVAQVVFSSTGNKALSLSSGSGVYLWNFESNRNDEHSKYLNPINGIDPLYPINCIDMAPDGEKVLIAQGDKVHLLNCEIGKEDYCFKHPHPAGSYYPTKVLCVTFSSDSKRVLSGDEHGVVCLWDCTTGKKLYSFEGHTDAVTNVVFSSDGKWVLSSSRDGTIRSWDINTPAIYKTKCMISSKLSHRYRLLDKRISTSFDGKWIITSAADLSNRSHRTISLLDSINGEERYKFVGFGHEGTNNRARSPDDKFTLSILDDSILVSESSNKKELLRLREQTYQKVNARRFLGSYYNEPERIHNTALSPDGNCIITWKAETLTLYRNNRKFKCLQLESRINEVDFLENGKSIVVSTNQGSVQQWKLFNEADHFHPSLKWCVNRQQFASAINSVFSAQDLNIQGVNGLSEENRNILC